MTKEKWQRFFDGHAPEYMKNVFTGNSEFEVGFMVKELGMEPGDRVLDVGCGTGRHSIPLAALGMKVTGLDLSEGMLEEARKYAESEKTTLELIRADATEFSFPDTFDHASCICEGSFGLLGDDDDAGDRDLSILKNICDSLKPGGTLLMTVLNGYKMVRQHNAGDVEAGTFDPVHNITLETMPVIEDGEEKDIRLREKGFTPMELHHMFKRANLEIQHLWGGTAGSWNKKTLDLDEYEIMVIARKAVP